MTNLKLAYPLPLIFVGMPASGKSTLARHVAALLDLPHIDTDDLVEQMRGVSVQQIFADEGEAAFRQYEAQAVADAVSCQAVVSLGGGALTTEEVRDLVADHTVIFVDAAEEELLRRVLKNDSRPLLRHDPQGTLRRLMEERRPHFEKAATMTVSSDSTCAQSRALSIVDQLTGTQRIHVGGASPYDVIMNTTQIAAHIAQSVKPECRRLLIIHSPGVASRAQALAGDLAKRNYAVHLMDHPDGEAAKNLDVLAAGWDGAARAGLSRTDVIIGFGGGATTDLAGFVAATWLRGIDIVQVPTTVLAMVDAAVGGKTGINTPAGKNLAGAFHTPAAVIEDFTLLDTLPPAELRAGLGEVVKCGFIRDAAILDTVLACPDAMTDVRSAQLADVMVRAVQVKADVVSKDLTESGLREILNYGHTLAHAIEKCENYRWRHGEAVSVGCIFAAELAHDRGMLSAQEVDLHRQAFSAVGLPTTYDGASFDELVSVMFSDKKVRAGTLRFVLLDGIGNPVTLPVSADELRAPAQRIGVTR